MEIQVGVDIQAPVDTVWNVITDIENSVDVISGIEEIEVLNSPDEGLEGFKWRETRTMFGKTATEDMWVTSVAEQQSYTVRAESHGAVYTSLISVAPEGESTKLTMSFRGEPQTFFTKIMTATLGQLFKGATRKALQKDMDDIKAHIERGDAQA